MNTSTEFGIVTVWIAGQCKFIVRGPIDNSAAVIHNGIVDYVMPR